MIPSPPEAPQIEVSRDKHLFKRLNLHTNIMNIEGLKIENAAVRIVDLPVRRIEYETQSFIVEFEGRNRQTLGGNRRGLTQNCCQTVHEEGDVFDSFHLGSETLDL